MRARTAALLVLLLASAAPSTASASLADARVVLTRIATLAQPIAMAVRPSDSALYFAEKGGRVKRLQSGQLTTILDISGRVSTKGEQGLLGITFSPGGNQLYVNYTNLNGNTNVRRFASPNGTPDLESERKTLGVGQPFDNHNGGNLAFGPDGYLYVGLGDGGGSGDPENRAQRLNTLLGKMLRIRPRSSGGYAIPGDNPFVGRTGKDEIWAYGLRNPWRYSFDKSTGNLWIGDVGQNAWEEIDFQSASSSGGQNYGWRLMEGKHQFGGLAPANHVPPIHEYAHIGGQCSVTGGYVYRGTKIPDLEGAYVFGDFCTGELKAFIDPGADLRSLGVTVSSLSSFGQDNAGELYAMSLGGGVFRIDPA